MEQVKWAAPATYGASKFEVMTVELHARPVAVVNTLKDACLISAAPELLAVLETTAGNLRSLIASCNCNTYDIWLAEIEAAIAKAKL